eukprot:26405-Pelagococcus_subviridis.AAC.1
MVRETCAASVSVATASCVARRGSTRASVSAARVLAFLSPPRSPPEVSAASFPRKTFTCAPAASAGGGGVPVRAMTSGAMTSGASTSAAFIDASSAAWLTRDRLSDFDNPPAPQALDEKQKLVPALPRALVVDAKHGRGFGEEHGQRAEIEQRAAVEPQLRGGSEDAHQRRPRLDRAHGQRAEGCCVITGIYLVVRVVVRVRVRVRAGGEKRDQRE